MRLLHGGRRGRGAARLIEAFGLHHVESAVVAEGISRGKRGRHKHVGSVLPLQGSPHTPLIYVELSIKGSHASKLGRLL